MEEFKERKRPTKICGVCGFENLKVNMLRSKSTNNYYCTNLTECGERRDLVDDPGAI